MARRTTSIIELYGGRHCPDGENVDRGARRTIRYEPDMQARDRHDNQDPEDRHGPKYDNEVDIKSWLRNGNAATKPGFDKSPPRDKMRR
jgi:hypothetical protein